MKPLAETVADYAPRLHRLVGDAHHVASPLGAWMLLALMAPIAQGGARDELESALGAPIDDAHKLALELLAEPHQAVPLAAAAWGIDTEVARAVFGPDVDVGDVPDQARADAWTREHTLDLIDEFPLQVADALAVLATAIATKISWWRPFELAPAERTALTPASGFARVTRLLRDPGGGPSRQLITDGDVGLVAVHAAGSKDDDLVVVSVSADPSVPYDQVLATAHPIATALARHESIPGQRSLFDLPLGAGHSWSIAESSDPTMDPEQFRTVLPAWSTTAQINLMAAPEVGFIAAADALQRVIRNADRVDAAQAAVARFTRTGFEAAAVTGMVVAAAAFFRPASGPSRTATLEFTHPYAVVAVARDDEGGPWSGLPVFSAWVTEADEPDEP